MQLKEMRNAIVPTLSRTFCKSKSCRVRLHKVTEQPAPGNEGYPLQMNVINPVQNLRLEFCHSCPLTVSPYIDP